MLTPQVGLLLRNLHPPEGFGISDKKEIADNILESFHRLASGLRPASLDHLGLIPALRQFLESFGERYDLQVQFEAIGLEGIRLPPEAEISLYRIIQEALTNVGRHAHATWAAVVLELRKDRIIAIVEDNGIGFDPKEAQQGGRLGILGMYERADMFGWKLSYETQQGAGTTLFVEIPYDGGALKKE
ncbi:MAG: hypothetical protein HY326_09870 [Chloroflexi bacterium]|nr:hypothetical protein [Chloroflexota bacterium]